MKMIPKSALFLAMCQLAEATIGLGAKKATKYLSRDYVVKATVKGKVDKRDRQTSIIVTVGRPNYAERQFIKDCVKAGESFPVKKVQLKWYPKKRAA